MTHTNLSNMRFDPCPVCAQRRGKRVFVKNGYDLRRCGNCGLVWVANPPSQAELARIYSFETGYHSDLSTDSQWRQRWERDAENKLRIVGNGPGRLLDVGSSVGLFVRAARNGGWDVEGVEVSPDTAAVARELAGVPIHPSLESVQGVFDVVTLWDVLEHVPDPRGTLERITALAPEGRLAIQTPNVGLFPKISLRAARILRRWPHAQPPYHLFQFTLPSLGLLLRQTGWKIDRVKHLRQPLSYTFGAPRSLLRDPAGLAYTALFAPLAQVGPWLGSGDEVLVTASRAPLG